VCDIIDLTSVGEDLATDPASPTAEVLDRDDDACYRYIGNHDNSARVDLIQLTIPLVVVGTSQPLAR